MIYRPLVLDCVDPVFLRSVSRSGGIAHLTFLALLVLNLISAFHAFGTLLGIGIIIIPAAVARFWTRDITWLIVLAMSGALLSGWAGLLLAFHAGIPSGPAVTLVAGVLYVVSVLFGRDRWPGLATVSGPPPRSLGPVLINPVLKRGPECPFYRRKQAMMSETKGLNFRICRGSKLLFLR